MLSMSLHAGSRKPRSVRQGIARRSAPPFWLSREGRRMNSPPRKDCYRRPSVASVHAPRTGSECARTKRKCNFAAKAARLEDPRHLGAEVISQRMPQQDRAEPFASFLDGAARHAALLPFEPEPCFVSTQLLLPPHIDATESNREGAMLHRVSGEFVHGKCN